MGEGMAGNSTGLISETSFLSLNQESIWYSKQCCTDLIKMISGGGGGQVNISRDSVETVEGKYF